MPDIALLGEISLQASILIVLLLAMRKWFKRRIDPRLLHAIYLIPLLRLLVPIRIQSSLSMFNMLPAPARQSLYAQAILAGGNYYRAAGQTPTPLTRIAESPVLFSWPDTILYIWLLGIMICLIWMLVANIRFTGVLRRRAKKLSLPVSCQSALSDSPVKAVFYVKNLFSPCMAGIFHPRIYVSRRACASEEVLRMTLRHEAAHARRLDNLWLLLTGIALALHWYNPLVWIAAYTGRQDMEAACDRSAMQGMDVHEREDYGLALIHLASRSYRAHSVLTATTASTGNKKVLEDRIRMIANHPKTKGAVIVALAMVCALAVAITCTTAMGAEENTDAATAVIGGADGPTAIFVTGQDGPLSEIQACSTLMELQAQEVSFRDMSEEELAPYIQPLSAYFDFRGRISEDGAYAYILGQLVVGENPLSALSVASYSPSGSTEEYLTFSKANSDGDPKHAEFVLKGVSSFILSQNENTLYLEPAGQTRSLYPAALLALYESSDGMEQLAALLARGVTVVPPANAPYAMIRLFRNGLIQTEYFPLTQDQILSFSSQETHNPAVVGDYAITYITGEGGSPYDEWLMNRPVPADLLKMAEDRCGFMIDEPSSIHDLVRAELVLGSERRVITDSRVLTELEEMLSSAQPTSQGKCPYTGVLTLTREDGKQIVLYKASDSCSGFILGSYSCYELKGAQNERFWTIFERINEQSWN